MFLRQHSRLRVRPHRHTYRHTHKHTDTHSTPPPASSFPEWAYEPRSFFRYELIHQSTKSHARVGRIHTPHGIIDTPAYVPVATNAVLKGVDFRTLDQNTTSSSLVFSNTYHLLLHPGREVIRDAGGLHKFTNRNAPFITDSGGFQVFSLAYGSIQSERNQTPNKVLSSSSHSSELKRGHTVHKNYWNNTAKDNNTHNDNQNTHTSSSSSHHHHQQNPTNPVQITEEGVTFTSYRDGTTQTFLSPEGTVDAQKDFGADIIIPLDELPPHHISHQTLTQSVHRSHRWEARSLHRHLQNVNHQAMYAVIHGGLDVKLRTESVEYLTSLPFDGYAIGGSLGKNRQELKHLLSWMMPLFQKEVDPRRYHKPRHLLGIADEESIRHAVTTGIDTMDSCYPTKLGRHGTLMTQHGLIRIKQGKHRASFGTPIDPGCQCDTCRNHDRAYLHHLFKGNEPLAVMLGTQHNLFYMQELMKGIRRDILNDKI